MRQQLYTVQVFKVFPEFTIFNNLFETYLGLGERVLADNFMEIVKEKYKENENFQLRYLAEDLMNKLVEIWEKGNKNF